MSTKPSITVFSWGYWGWGTEAALFLKAVDAVEVSRGFDPPVFVDVRISRSVRATYFRDAAFENIVGVDRYRWMNGLGNLAIQDPSLGTIKINRPEDAGALLDLALQARDQNQRLLFFCACSRPSECHRRAVGDLLLKAARRRDLSIEVLEWPGRSAEAITERVSEEDFARVKRGLKNLPLPVRPDLARYGSIGWGSVAEVAFRDEQMFFLTGPVVRNLKRWALPLLEGPFENADAAWKASATFRKERGYEVCRT